MTQASNRDGGAAKRVATRVQERTIGEQEVGRRLDNFLMSQLRETPRSLIYKLLRSGQVRVNSRRAKPAYRLVAGDRVRLPPMRNESADDPLLIPARRITALESCILLEDPDLIVLDKPAGLACHAGTGLRYGVIEIMRAARPHLERLDLAHRIDRDTSGCLVLTKNIATLRSVHACLRDRRTEKLYDALLCGRLESAVQAIESRLVMVRDAGGERRARAQNNGREARTLIERAERVGNNTLVRLRLITGRMHQIRAQAQQIGHPLAGDPVYGDPSFNRALAGAVGLNRMFLHATSISMKLPGKELAVSAPLPDILATTLARLRALSD